MAILVAAHEISKSYGARTLFKGLRFVVESGDRIGLIGPNGAGKSTLLRVLVGETSPDSGTISYQRGVRISLLEQVPRFTTEATVLSTVKEGLVDPSDTALAHECLARLALHEPDRKIAELSGGWQKRAALARELAKRPDV